MTEFRNTSDLMNTLVRIAHKIADEYDHQEECQKILDAVHDLRGRSLMGSMPENSLMMSLSLLMQDLGIQFAVIGAVAVSVHGQVRNTEDIDVLVSSLPPAEKISDSEYMKRFGFYKSKSSTGTILVIDHRQNGMVELLLASDPLKSWALSTAKPYWVLGSQVPVVSPEALVALKVHAITNNPSRLSKDGPDILSISLKSNFNFDDVKSHLSQEEIEVLNSII